MQAAVEQIAAMAQQLHDQDHDDDEGPSNDNGDGSGSGNGLKRKAEDGQTQQQRARRNRYVSIACNQCKRRKIKCNGETPCQRCGNLNLECVYAPNCCNGFKDSQEFKDMSQHISMLQDQINALWEAMNAMRIQIANGEVLGQQMHMHLTPIDPSLQSPAYQSHPTRGSSSFPDRQASPRASHAAMSPSVVRRKSQSQSKTPGFRGPTSSVFNFGVAKNSLETMGITSQVNEDINGSTGAGIVTAEVTPEPLDTNPPSIPTALANKDPIWSVSRDEALRLCRVYEDEMGVMYPVVDVDKVVSHATGLYRFIEAAHRTGLMRQDLPGADAIDDEDTNILKLILATALTVEACGRSELGHRLFESVQPAIDNMLLGNAGIKGVRLLTMAAMYEFHRDNEGTSWRMIGLTARLCIELGLHRRETYDAMEEADRTDTMLLFWAIYVLDRRWSFGTGMPFALQESDIDPQLPKPEERSPYLSAMITYATISGKVWRSISAPTSATRPPINTEEMDYFDYQILQWLRNIPAHLRFEHPSQTQNVTMTTPLNMPSSRAAKRLRILLYLRANQMRIHIYRPVLHSATCIMGHREQAQTVVDVAKDTVRVLTNINQTSDLYHTQQVTFNAFLTSALAVLFLAVSHTPALFAEDVREEFYMSLELVRGFSKGSWVSKRLWKTIRVLKEVGPKLGLIMKDSAVVSAHNNSSNEDLDPSRSAAVAMAGLAGHNIDEMFGAQQQHGQWSGVAGSSSSPENMVHDLTSLFEAAGGYAALSGHDGNFLADGMDNFNGDEGLTHILKELF